MLTSCVPTFAREQYFTVTTLDGFLSGMNEMKALPDKLENYKANAVAEGDPDAAILREPEYKLDDADGACKAFVQLLYAELGLEDCLKGNYKAHYTDKGVAPASPETAETRMIVFDGDFFRRIFPLILSLHNAQDLIAYMKYNVIMWGGGYCTQVLLAMVGVGGAEAMVGMARAAARDRRHS